jgi:hypothetical protein
MSSCGGVPIVSHMTYTICSTHVDMLHCTMYISMVLQLLTFVYISSTVCYLINTSSGKSCQHFGARNNNLEMVLPF